MKDNEHENAQVEDAIEPELSDTDIDPELAEVEEQIDGKIKSLRAKLKDSEEKRSAALEELQRTKADFLNAKRRLEGERDEKAERAIESCLLGLLPLYDSFQMAMQNQEVWETVDETWRKGVEGIYSQLQTIFTSYNATILEPTNETFNPIEHEAMKEELVEDDTQNNCVLQVIQCGLTRTRSDGSTKVLRPARVVVGTISNTNEQ